MGSHDPIPNELLLEILHHLPTYDRETLLNFSLACRALRCVSRPRIFAHFYFPVYRDGAALLLPSPTGVDCCLERLNFWCSPEIAPFVRSCEITRSQKSEWSFATYSPYILLDAVLKGLALFTRLQRLETSYIHFTPARVDTLRHLPTLSNLNVSWCTFVSGRYAISSSRLRVSSFEELKWHEDQLWIRMLHPDHLHTLRTTFHPRALDVIPSFPNLHTLDVTMHLLMPEQNVAILNKFPALQVLKLRGKNLLTEAVSLSSPPVLPALTEYYGPYQYLPIFLALDTLAHLTITCCTPSQFISCTQGVQPNITSISVEFTVNVDFNIFDIATFGTLVARLPELTDIRIRIVVHSRAALFEGKTRNLQKQFGPDVVVRGQFGNSIRTGFKVRVSGVQPSAFFSALPSVPALPHGLERLTISWDCNSLQDVHHVCAYNIPDFAQLRDALRARCPELTSIYLHGLFYVLQWRDAVEN
ncbi:hypothetical protein DFH06DRAFT_1405992 [Mycena polygramma]|nr:hypothetical protein DFH06DRAFT_1405992 [Mycena polygramma]